LALGARGVVGSVPAPVLPACLLAAERGTRRTSAHTYPRPGGDVSRANDDGRLPEAAEDPGTAHGLTLAALIEAKRQRERDLTAAIFGVRTDNDSEGDPDDH
jgi:hypothetical protein